MQIFVNSVRGNTLTLSVAPEASVESVKALNFARDGIPAEDQRLLYAGKQLVDGRNLADYGIQKDATLHMSLRYVWAYGAPGT